MPFPTAKFLDCSLDCVTDLTLTAGCNAIVTIVDWLTKWVTLVTYHMGPDHPLGVEKVASLFFHQIVCHFGIAHSLVHDCDIQFTLEFWTHLWCLVGTMTLFSSVHHLQMDR